MEGLIFRNFTVFCKKTIVAILKVKCKTAFFRFVFFVVCLLVCFFFFAVLSLQFVFNPLSPNIRIQIPQTDLCTFS